MSCYFFLLGHSYLCNAKPFTMKQILFILFFISSSLFGQTNDRLILKGDFINNAHPVKTQLLISESGEPWKILYEGTLSAYHYSLEIDKIYQVRFEYSEELVKTIVITPKTSEVIHFNVDFGMTEKPYCVLNYEPNGLYGVYLLSDEDLIAAQKKNSK